MKVSIYGWESSPIVFNCESAIIGDSRKLLTYREVPETYYYEISVDEGYCLIVQTKNEIDVHPTTGFCFEVFEYPDYIRKLHLFCGGELICTLNFKRCKDLLSEIKKVHSNSTNELFVSDEGLCSLYFVRVYSFLEELGVSIDYEKKDYHICNKLELYRNKKKFVALRSRSGTKIYFQEEDGKKMRWCDDYSWKCLRISNEELRKRDALLINDILFELRDDFISKERKMICDVLINLKEKSVFPLILRIVCEKFKFF